jgi:hypothetical protein
LFAATVLAAFGFMLGSAGPVVACSCAMPGSLAEEARPETAIFSGTADLQQARGVPVAVDQWFWGAGASTVVWLSSQSFGDGASCGVGAPPPGSRWIWVTWRQENEGDFLTGLCSPSGNLATPEGQAMLDEAVATFANGVLPSAAALPPVESAPTSPPPADRAPAADQTGFLVGGAIAIATLALFGGIVLAARRRPA